MIQLLRIALVLTTLATMSLAERHPAGLVDVLTVSSISHGNDADMDTASDFAKLLDGSDQDNNIRLRQLVENLDAPEVVVNGNLKKATPLATTNARLQHHRRMSTQYTQACADPTLLYEGTDYTASCTCDPDVENLDRIVCAVGGIVCDPNSGVCVRETDTWGFDETDGQLIARSTCVNCVELGANSTVCMSWLDTCFYAEFDTSDDMSRCLLIYSEISTSSSLKGCDSCAPCLEDDDVWGMNFDCFPYWNSRGQCMSASRIGHHPFDEFIQDGDSSVVTTAPPPADGDRGSISNASANSDVHDSDSDMKRVFVAVVVAVVLALVCAVAIGVCLCTRKKRRNLEEGQSPPPPTVADVEDSTPGAMPSVGYTTAEVYGGDSEKIYGKSINIAEKLDASATSDGNTVDESFAASL